MFKPDHSKALTARQIVPMLITLVCLAILVPQLFAQKANPTTAHTAKRRLLTLEQRVHYQGAIEQVYWRYRTWPKENPQPKPSLDKLLPPSAVQAKVQDYLTKSQALEAMWNRPITEDLLRAEVNRITRDTRRRGMLQELWAALDNDPYVIEECLARTSLVNRRLGELQTQHIAQRGGSNNAKGRVLLAELISLPADDAFIPAARSLHAAVWTRR